jgi:DNA-binding transcriptional regulator PaaX
MARTLSPLSQAILGQFETKATISLEDIYDAQSAQKSKKEIYNTVYRLTQQELLEAHEDAYTITQRGKQFINKFFPKKDGIWKIIIFDIPEKKRYIRTVLRSRLESIGFKKWQNSIWISPYALDPSIEEELSELAKHYFVRLIKTTDINFTEDLEELFADYSR